jgi:hypothetical protein
MMMSQKWPKHAAEESKYVTKYIYKTYFVDLDRGHAVVFKAYK